MINSVTMAKDNNGSGSCDRFPDSMMDQQGQHKTIAGSFMAQQEGSNSLSLCVAGPSPEEEGATATESEEHNMAKTRRAEESPARVVEEEEPRILSVTSVLEIRGRELDACSNVFGAFTRSPTPTSQYVTASSEDQGLGTASCVDSPPLQQTFGEQAILWSPNDHLLSCMPAFVSVRCLWCHNASQEVCGDRDTIMQHFRTVHYAMEPRKFEDFEELVRVREKAPAQVSPAPDPIQPLYEEPWSHGEQDSIPDSLVDGSRVFPDQRPMIFGEDAECDYSLSPVSDGGDCGGTIDSMEPKMAERSDEQDEDNSRSEEQGSSLTDQLNNTPTDSEESDKTKRSSLEILKSSESEDPCFSCVVCDARFALEADVASHVRSHDISMFYRRVKKLDSMVMECGDVYQENHVDQVGHDHCYSAKDSKSGDVCDSELSDLSATLPYHYHSAEEDIGAVSHSGMSVSDKHATDGAKVKSGRVPTPSVAEAVKLRHRNVSSFLKPKTRDNIINLKHTKGIQKISRNVKKTAHTSNVVCEKCGKGFQTKRARDIHATVMHGKIKKKLLPPRRSSRNRNLNQNRVLRSTKNLCTRMWSERRKRIVNRARKTSENERVQSTDQLTGTCVVSCLHCSIFKRISHDGPQKSLVNCVQYRRAIAAVHRHLRREHSETSVKQGVDYAVDTSPAEKSMNLPISTKKKENADSNQPSSPAKTKKASCVPVPAISTTTSISFACTRCPYITSMYMDIRGHCAREHPDAVAGRMIQNVLDYTKIF